MKKTYNTPFGVFSLESTSKIGSYFERGHYDQADDIKLLGQFITKESVVLDIGAHVGTFTVPMAKLAKEVHAFEPIEVNIEDLRNNVSLNHLLNVRIHGYALGKEAGWVGMKSLSEGNKGGFSITSGDEFEVKTLDSVTNYADLIKIDVEGVEPWVLAGGEKLIEQCKPIIYFEMNIRQLRLHFRHPLRILSKFFKGHGYKLYLNTEKGLCRVPTLWVVCLALQPRTFVLGQKGGVFDLLALTERPNQQIKYPLLYILGVFARKFLGN